MAELRCPNCGKENPASLSVCQFCGSQLASETMRSGEKPTKKTTGELEPVLPDWLKDIRSQAREAAEKDAAETASMPKIQKEEPPDLLAGLAFQSSAGDEEDVPDWLAGLTPKKDEKPVVPSAPSEPKFDFFSQFEQQGPGSKSEASPPEPPSPVSGPAAPSAASPERDELSEWFAQASEQPAEPFSQEEAQELHSGWGAGNENTPGPFQETPPLPQEDEDLSWLRDLEAESKKTGELNQPKKEDDWTSVFGGPAKADSSTQDDLSWLNSLGSLPASEEPKQPAGSEDLNWRNTLDAPSQPGQQEDLSWLNNLGAFSPSNEPAENAPTPGDDLGWLNTFIDSSPPARGEVPAPSASQDDLSWLDDLGTAPLVSEPTGEPPAPGEDLGWLRELQDSTGSISAALAASSLMEDQPSESETDLPHVSPFTPRRTAPLDESADTSSMPDWLKNATEEPSMPLGPQALDRMRGDPLPGGPSDQIPGALFGAVMHPKDVPPVEPPPVEAGEPSPTGEASALFGEVNSLFSEDLPDWLSSPQTEGSQAAEEVGVHAEGGEALSPADLPTWVQAMRPVEALIAVSTPVADDQPVEREGPLAGLKGVIPLAAIGMLRRPQPIPLKLQANDEQQASAAILEETLLAETTPRPLAASAVVISQRQLRWLIAGLLLFVLGAIIFSGTQIMPVPAPLAADNNIMNTVMNISENAPVLVILDYEPALAGEMEAVSGPLLDQLVQSRDPYLSFISTSPNGNVLVDRLLANTNISPPGGTTYIEGQNYSNLGFLPGGEAGVLGFIQSPQTTIPASRVLEFSEYAAIFLLTDHAETARTWVEQLHSMKQTDPAIASQPLLAVASAQAGPMLQPYVASGQINGMISGLPNAARYEVLNNNRPGTVRTYWDAFGMGMLMAVLAIVIGSLWSLFTGIRARRAQAAEE